VDVLASSQPHPYALAIDATNLYWTNVASGAGNGSVMSCAIGGCSNAPTTLASGMHIQYPYGIALAGGSVFWTSFNFTGEVNSVPTTGGTMTTVATGLGFPYELAISGSTVMAVLYGQGGAVATFPTSGGSPNNIAAGQSFPEEGTTDGTNAYWTLWEPASSTSATLMKGTLAKYTTPQILATGTQPAGSVTVDSQWVYWLDNGGTVRKTAK
jgi:hypothetical protein